MVIPTDWAWKTLGDVTSLIPGGVYGEEFPRTQLIGMPVATTAHIDMSDRWNSKEMNIRYFSKEHVQTYAPQFGDLIVVKSSGSAASIQSGKLGFVDQNRAGKFIFSNFLMLLRPLNICPKFLYFYVSSNNVKRLIPTLVEASTYPNIRIPEYLEVQICVPPLKEQEVIAEALSDADAAIESLDALIAKKRDVKQAMMQQLLTGRTRLPGFNADWKEVRLGDLVSRPITDGPHLTPRFYDDGVPFLSVNNIVDGKILWNELRYISKEDDKVFSVKCKPRRGDILFGKAASVGKIALVDTDFDFNVWSPLAVIRCSSLSSSQFVYFALQTSWTTRQIALLTNSSSQGNIGMTDIAQIKISLPPVKEQEAIAEALTVMDDELEGLTEQVLKLRMVKEGMMQDLLTGKVRLV